MKAGLDCYVIWIQLCVSKVQNTPERCKPAQKIRLYIYKATGYRIKCQQLFLSLPIMVVWLNVLNIKNSKTSVILFQILTT